MSEAEHEFVPIAEDQPGDGDEPDEETEAEEAEHEDELETVRELEEAEASEVERAHRAYLEAVYYHFGPEAPIGPCPLCEARGYLDFSLAADPEVEACAACSGRGVTRTGSMVEGNETRPCPRCNGCGFKPREGQPEGEQPPRLTAPASVPLPPSAFPLPAPSAAEVAA